jgi:hypothetical protein
MDFFCFPAPKAFGAGKQKKLIVRRCVSINRSPLAGFGGSNHLEFSVLAMVVTIPSAEIFRTRGSSPR